MSDREKEREKRKKEKDAWLEQQIMMIMEKSMKAALDKALDDLLKGWN